MWQTALTVLVTYSLGMAVCLNSNGIRTSKEILESLEQTDALPSSNTSDTSGTTLTLAQNPPRTCSTPGCRPPEKEGCSNRSQRRGTSTQDREADRQGDRQANRQTDSEITVGNRTRGSCVRSGDCQPGFCCVRYLTAKRCQRVPLEGDACLLPGRSKRRRNLERCSCGQGLYCSPAGPTVSGAAKKQGVCLNRPGQGQRNTRHSGKSRRTAEGGC
ncbi:unnamed protein product [Arctogadus glacialis]